ncbi:hypothetical protein K523DRAFT_293223 [Schizophyllum commune Tattone D]|nr:hypothetical protein K523DRAFT_293223 [Schizophyllum commune Tattone D]
MPKVTSKKAIRSSDAVIKVSRPVSERESSRAKTSVEAAPTTTNTKKNAVSRRPGRAALPYDRPTKAERGCSPTVKREGSRLKAAHSSANVGSSSSSGFVSSDPPIDFTAKAPKVLGRKFIGDTIVMLRLQLMHDMDQIRLQYRDGTPLPRPNTAAMGFELYDRLNRCSVDWNGYGTPLVYRAHVYKRGSYVLRHKGRDVWEYSTDDWAAYWKEQEELSKVDTDLRGLKRATFTSILQIPYDYKKWDEIMKHIEYGFRNPIQAEVNVLVHAGPNLIGVEPLPYGPDPSAYLPEHLFPRCDLESTHQLREYKRRTGKVYRA